MTTSKLCPKLDTCPRIKSLIDREWESSVSLIAAAESVCKKCREQANR